MNTPTGALERARANVLATLTRALTAELHEIPRDELIVFYVDLEGAKRLQLACGMVSPWNDWRRARLRLEEELDVRPGRWR